MRKLLGTIAIGGALAFAAPSTAEAQNGPVVTGGLVNVTVSGNDILNNVAVGVALSVAATLCNTTVNLLASDLGPDGNATCTTTSGAPLEITQRRRAQ